jgi:hypothetical protein
MRSALEAVAQDCCDKSGCANAQALLTLVLSQRFDERIVFSNTTAMRTLSEVRFDKATFAVYPNPANQMIQIMIPEVSDESVLVTLYDVSGREVYHVQHISNGEALLQVDVSFLAEGLYTISISSNDGSRYMERLIINH